MSLTVKAEDIKFILQSGTMYVNDITDINKGVYHYCPYWFKKIDDNTYEVLFPDNLPKELVDGLKELRTLKTN
jgi:hypothetical protein